MKTVIKSMKLDLYAVFSQKSYAILMLCLLPTYAILKMYHSVFLIPALLIVFTFYFEEKGFHYHIAAPINKTDKVAGRYLLLAVMYMVCFVCSTVLFAFLTKGPWPEYCSDMLNSFTVFGLLSAFLMPFYFKFGHNSMTIIIVLVLCVIFVMFAVIIKVGVPIAEINRFIVNIKSLKIFGLFFTILAISLSYLISYRIYTRTDL